jgi:hypothetical protein
MTEIEQKALALAIEAREDDKMRLCPDPTLTFSNWEALCRSIERHEAFKQEVSDAITVLLDRCVGDSLSQGVINGHLHHLIIPKPKADPLVEVLADTYGASLVNADDLRAALEARGLEIREKGQ